MARKELVLTFINRTGGTNAAYNQLLDDSNCILEFGPPVTNNNSLENHFQYRFSGDIYAGPMLTTLKILKGGEVDCQRNA